MFLNKKQKKKTSNKTLFTIFSFLIKTQQKKILIVQNKKTKNVQKQKQKFFVNSFFSC